MKKIYKGLEIVLIWSIIVIIAIIGFIWETIDVGKFVAFSFITSIILPFILEIILISIFCQYIIIDYSGIKKYIFKRKIIEYKSDDIKEIRIDSGTIYISLERLPYEKKFWDKKKYIHILYSDKAIKELNKYFSEKIVYSNN